MFETLALPFWILISAGLLSAVANGVWVWRFSKLSTSYEQARMRLGGSSLRKNGRSPLAAPGWLSLLPFAVAIPVIWWLAKTAEFPSVFPWEPFVVLAFLVNLAQVAYNEFVSKWARPRRLLRRAVFAFDEESREAMIREAVAADPDVGDKARAASGVPGAAQAPRGVAGGVYMGDTGGSAEGPRLSDAPPPL